MALDFVTGTCSVKRLVTTGMKKEYQTIITNLDIDIQPNSWEQIFEDAVLNWFIWYVATENSDYILYNDLIVSEGKEYKVNSTRYYKWNNFIPGSLELYLIENLTK